MKTCNSFTYLDTIINTKATWEEEIENGIVMGKRATKTLHDHLWNRNMSMNVFIYGSEVRPITAKNERKNKNCRT